MISAAWRTLARLRPRWKPLNFDASNCARIPIEHKIEEETFPNYVASRYYPARIGETLREQYQLVGKLGTGVSSTVWLARDLSKRRHVALKLFIRSTSLGEHAEDELNIYKRMQQKSLRHPGRKAVRVLLDSFNVSGPDGEHQCLVHAPLFESMLALLHRNPIAKLPSPLLAIMLKRLFMALDYLHTECEIIHTDIKADNIMIGIEDMDVFKQFERDEQTDPSPRKILPDREVYISRELDMTRDVGPPILCDFGSAVLGDQQHSEDIQPNIYRAPEVILEVPWTYSVDIWNAGCMVWDLFEGGSLFTGQDPELQTYRKRAHLAEMVALLGPPPASLISRGRASHKFFTEDGNFCAAIPLPPSSSLAERETTLEGEDQASFLRLMHKMLKWVPEERATPKELIEDEWIERQIRGGR